jgi:hypothetical protein
MGGLRQERERDHGARQHRHEEPRSPPAIASAWSASRGMSAGRDSL